MPGRPGGSWRTRSTTVPSSATLATVAATVTAAQPAVTAQPPD
jgi:hypothetical protein